MSSLRLVRFVTESNLIEGIDREPTEEELLVSRAFLDLERPTIADLERFVETCQPGAKLRVRPGMNVTIADYMPRPGGPNVRVELESLLGRVHEGEHPYPIHVQYEKLHPFMDGNGRSGRILWAWQMVNQDRRPGLALGFLHAWYYQSLEAAR